MNRVCGKAGTLRQLSVVLTRTGERNDRTVGRRTTARSKGSIFSVGLPELSHQYRVRAVPQGAQNR